MKKSIFSVLLCASILTAPVSAFAHPGRTDSNGGHWDRSTNTYHYHNDGDSSSNSSSASSSSNDYYYTGEDPARITELKNEYWYWKAEADTILFNVDTYEDYYNEVYAKYTSLGSPFQEVGFPPTYSFNSARTLLSSDYDVENANYASVIELQIGFLSERVEDTRKELEEYYQKLLDYHSKLTDYEIELEQKKNTVVVSEPVKTSTVITQPTTTQPTNTAPTTTKENSKPRNPDEIAVFIDGKEIEFDQPPVILENRTLVPFRQIAEELGATVTYDDSTKTAMMTKDKTTITLTIASKIAYVNSEAVTLDCPAQIINNRTLVPIRFVSENFGVEVRWNDEERSISINKAQGTSTQTSEPVQTQTPEPTQSQAHYTTSYGPRGGAICWCGKYMSQH